MKTLPLSLLAFASFAAGLGVTFLWPREAPSPAPRGRAALSGTSPLAGRGAAGGLAGASRLARLAEARDRAAGLSAAEARAALLALPRPPAEADREWWSTLLTRWAEEEPAEALAWLRTENGFLPVPYAMVLPALTAAARRDLRLAFITAREWPREGHRDLFRAAAAGNPRAVVEFAAANGSPSAEGLAAAFSEWMRLDSAAAAEWLREREKSGMAWVAAAVMDDLRTLPPEDFERLLSALPAAHADRLREKKAECESREDPAAALARLPELKGAARAGTLKGAVAGLLRTGDAPALGRLLASLKGYDRALAVASFSGADSVPPEAVRALTELKELTPDERLSLFSRLSRHLGPDEFIAGLKNQGPEDTAWTQNADRIVRDKWAGWLREGGEKEFAAFGRLLREGAVDAGEPLRLVGAFGRERNPEAARRLLESLPEDQRALPQALHTAFQSLRDPAVDPAPVAALPREDRRRVFNLLFATDFAARPDQGAGDLAFVERLPGNMRAEALAQLLWQRPAAGAAYEPVIRKLAQESGGGQWTPELRECLIGFARMDASHDPAAAFARAEIAPAGPEREEVARTVFSEVVQEQTVAASAWLARQPEGQRRDSMAGELARRIQSSDPAGAWEWASSIRTDPAERRRLQEEILPRWRAADPQAAEAAASALAEGATH